MTLSDMPNQSKRGIRYFKDRLIAELDVPPDGTDIKDIETAAKITFASIVEDEGLTLSAGEFDYFWSKVWSETFGLGPLDALLADDAISEIVVLGLRAVYVVRDGLRVELALPFFEDYDHLRGVIYRIFRPPMSPLGYKGPVLSEKIEDNAIVTCVFPNDNFLDPVLVIHNI